MLASQILTAAVALAVGAVAQDASASPSASPTIASSATSSPTSTNGPRVVEIAVGAELHKFSPDSVTAKVGDIIRFNFYPGGHRVARAEYKQACIPYEYTGANKVGFYTGIFSPNVITNPLPHYDVRVNDTNPIFFYCGAPGSCIQYGMVGVINPSKNETLEVQKEFAANSTRQLVPGDPWPSETLSPTPTPTGVSSGQGSGGSTQQDQQNSSNSPGLGAGAIAGIAIGAAAVLILGAALIYLCGRRGGLDRAYRKSIQQHGGVPPNGPFPPPIMVQDAKAYGGPGGMKSPGQQSTSTFSPMANGDPNNHHDPYRVSAQSPHAASFSTTPPPPMSPGMNGYVTYQTSAVPGTPGYPLMADIQGQYHHPQHTTPPPMHMQQQQQVPPHQLPTQMPVELPTADHPVTGHSPPPQYPQSNRRDSWTAGVQEHYSKP